jgi:serine/threonine-protein kinase
VSETILGGTYRIIRKIGAGGMADVYEVEHVRLGSRFAAKVARSLVRDESTHRRFFREARMLANLRSDHIVTVFDVSGPDVDPPFMVMELLLGQDLRELLRSTPTLAVERAVKLASHACLGLIAVHAAGVVHRDLKPENLFVSSCDTGEEWCRLLDFGVIKASQGTSTQHGGLIGTIKYMAPEQIENSGRVTPLSDVRSLAAILYECLVGRPPFEAPSVEQLLYRILNERPDSMRSLRADVPLELDQIVMRALEREPSLRFPSARAFADALRPFARPSTEQAEITLSDGDSRPRPNRVPGVPAHAWSRRLVLALGLVGAVGTASLVLASRGPNPREPAPLPAAKTAPALEESSSPPAPPPDTAAPALTVLPSELSSSAPLKLDRAAEHAPHTKDREPRQVQSGASPGPGAVNKTRASQSRSQVPAITPVSTGGTFLKIDPKSPYDP